MRIIAGDAVSLRAPPASTDSGPMAASGCAGGGATSGSGRGGGETTWVTGASVSLAIRSGRPAWSHFEKRIGSVETMISS